MKATKSKVSVEIEVERGDAEVIVNCVFTLWPRSRGARDKYGVPLEPDEEAELELHSSTVDGKAFALTEKEWEWAEETAWDKLLEARESWEP